MGSSSSVEEWAELHVVRARHPQQLGNQCLERRHGKPESPTRSEDIDSPTGLAVEPRAERNRDGPSMRTLSIRGICPPRVVDQQDRRRTNGPRNPLFRQAARVPRQVHTKQVASGLIEKTANCEVLKSLPPCRIR